MLGGGSGNEESEQTEHDWSRRLGQKRGEPGMVKVRRPRGITAKGRSEVYSIC